MESPNLFGQALEHILKFKVTLVQYVDNLLLAEENENEVKKKK